MKLNKNQLNVINRTFKVALVMLVLALGVYLPKVVTVHASDSQYKISTTALDVDTFMKENAKDFPGYYVSKENLDNGFLKNGDTIKLVKEKTLSVNINGEETQITTKKDTYAQLLNELDVEMNSSDYLTNSSGEKVLTGDVIESGEEITVNKVEVKIRSEIKEIEYETITAEDDSMYDDEKEVSIQGENGEIETTFADHYINGELQESTKIEDIEKKDVVDKEVTVGTKKRPKPEISAPRAPAATGSHTDWMAQAGIAESDYGYVEYIVNKESTWGITAKNAKSGAYGLCQSKPGDKMASHGSDWETNPVTQLKWCDWYAHDRYGSWEKAYNAHIIKNWW